EARAQEQRLGARHLRRVLLGVNARNHLRRPRRRGRPADVVVLTRSERLPQFMPSGSGGVMSDSFDLVVIGSGPAGEKGAAQAAYFNKTVAIVEQAPTPGGVAVSSAGVPTKTLRETALYVSSFRHREVYGLGLRLDPRTALEHLMTRKSELVTLMT